MRGSYGLQVDTEEVGEPGDRRQFEIQEQEASSEEEDNDDDDELNDQDSEEDRDNLGQQDEEMVANTATNVNDVPRYSEVSTLRHPSVCIESSHKQSNVYENQNQISQFNMSEKLDFNRIQLSAANDAQKDGSAQNDEEEKGELE